METILMDNGLFAEENNILPHLFSEEERKGMSNLFMHLKSEIHKDSELVQGLKETDLSEVDFGTKTCLLFNDTAKYMSQIEKKESIYSQLYQQFENITFETFLYKLPDNNRQYDFDRYWKKVMESNEEMSYIKTKTGIDDSQLCTILSTMRESHFDGNKKNTNDNDLNSSVFKDEQQLRCFLASICTSYIMLFNQHLVKTNHHDGLIILTVIETFIYLIQDKYDKWFKIVGEKGVENQVKVLSQMIFETKNPDVIILLSFLQHLLLNSYNNGGDYQFTSFIHPYCNTMARKMKFMEFLKSHPFGKDYCVEYEKYCKSHQVEPLFNTNTIIGTMELERDNTINNNMYYKLDENRFCNKSLIGEYTALSKLYDALKNYGTPTRDYKELFIYRFSGIYQKDTPLEKYRSENKMEWNWTIKQTLPVVIRLLFQDEKTGRIPYKAIALYFGIEDTNGFSSLCKKVGNNSLESIRAMLTDCGFTGLDDIVQRIKKRIN